MGPKNKKGKRRGDSDSEDEVVVKAVADLKVSDEGKKGAAPAAAAGGGGKKAGKKAGKKGGKGDDSDDGEDPLAMMKRLAAAGSDDDEGPPAPASKASKAAPPPAPAPAQKAKNNKKGKGGKGGKGGDSDDDEDPLAMMKRLAQADEEESDDEPAAPTPTPAAKAAPTPAPVAAKAKTPTPAPVAKPSPQDDDDDDSDEDDKPDVPVKQNKKMSKADRKKQKAAQKNRVSAASQPDADDDDDEEDEENDGLQKEEVAAAAAPVMPTAARAEVAAVAPVPEAASSSSSSAASAPSTPAATTPTQAAPAPASAAAAPAAAPAAPAKEAPKSKLQLKLEKARAEKAAADEAKRIADQELAELEKAAAAEAALLKKEQDKAAKAEAKRLEEERIARGEEAPSATNTDTPTTATTASLPTSRKPTNTTQPQEQLTEEEKEARLKATMFGDDVFDEYAKPNQGEGVDGGDADDGKKLSRKEIRRKAQEDERKEREAEYNLAMIKASAEGAQFAVSQSIIDPNDPNWMNALDVVIPSISISAHNKELFVNTELLIAHGRRYGLVGPNGAGKSTLLKMIAGGELKIPPRIDYLYVEQEVIADETPAVDAVLRADKVRWALVEEEKQLLKDLEKGPNEAKDVRLGEVYEQLAQIGASSAEARARRILFGLGFDAEMQIRPTKYFSGGWRMRISLARALFIEPTLLMLDEPTNHLDLNAVIWLDDYLQKWKKTLLIVSHDQDFLNSVCQEILHLDDKKLVTYKGNYDTFKVQEEMKRKQQQKAWEKQEKRLRELKAKGITKQAAEKEQLKQRKREPGARSKKEEAKAVATGGLESGENQIELIKRPREYAVSFEFPEVQQISPPILEVRDVNFRYGPSLPWLFRNTNFGLDMESRVCIVGPNGSGKSTILKIITGDLNPPEGEVRRNPRLRVGVYNQHFVDRLPMEEDPVTYLRRLFNEETYQSCRNMLGRYGLEGHAHTIPIRDLSGGQKARVVFVELSLMAPHILFLDEPTNNLDIESIDALCDALKIFNGGVVLVSHDARLIESTNCQLWVVEGQDVQPWESGFQGYREHLLRRLEDQLAAIMPGAGERPK